MEQLCGSMAMMDNEGFIRVLGDLMAQNKGFQIMITVPSDKSRECEKKAVKETQEEISLERDVTGMLHKIGVPAHIKGYQYLREAIIYSVEDPEMLGGSNQDSISCHSQKITYNIQQGRKGNPPCHRSSMEQRL